MRKRILVRLNSKKSGYFYTAYLKPKNLRKVPGEKLVLRKYDPIVRQVVEFEESSGGFK